MTEWEDGGHRDEVRESEQKVPGLSELEGSDCQNLRGNAVMGDGKYMTEYVAVMGRKNGYR